jgi:hypothetical protein
LKPGREALMRHSYFDLARGDLVSAPSLIVIAFEISDDVALFFPSNSSRQHDADQFHLMFGFQIKPKDERVLCRQARSGSKNTARCE